MSLDRRAVSGATGTSGFQAGIGLFSRAQVVEGSSDVREIRYAGSCEGVLGTPKFSEGLRHSFDRSGTVAKRLL